MHFPRNFQPVIFAALATVSASQAQTTFIWDGGHAAQDSWSMNQNWNPNGAPTNDGTANLVFTGTVRLAPDANGGWSVNSMTFDAFAGAFTIVGAAVTIQGTAVTNAIVNDSSNNVSIANALTVGAAQSWNANTADLAFTGTIALGANTLTLTGSASTSASGIISGTGALIKTGAGTVTLNGANTYSGGTTVSAGTLQGTSTSLQGNITNNAAVVFDQAANGTYAGVISGTGSLTKLKTGTLTLSAVNTYTGATSVNAGTLELGVANALASSTSVTIAGGATLQMTGGAQTVSSFAGAGSINLGSNTLTAGSAASTAFSGTIAGTGALVKTGSGTLTLTGANTYSGGTTISTGTLLGSSTSLQGNIANNAALIFDQAANGTYAGIVSGLGTFTKQNSGSLTLTGTNTYTGATTISAGTLALGTANALSSASAVTISNGATLQISAGNQTLGSFAGAGNIDLGASALTTASNASTTLSGAISGVGGSLVKNGSGTLTLSGINNYSGGTTVAGGVLQGTTSSLQGNILNNAAVVFDQTTSGTYAGVLSGSGSLTKQNTGTVILTGANNYTGNTNIVGGTLQGSTTSLQGNLSVNPGAAVVFDQGSLGTYSNDITGGGSLTKQNSGTLILTGTNTYTGGTTVSAGTLQGSTASLVGNIMNQASVVFDQSSNGTFAGVVSGTGSLTKQNAGTLTLTGANTYSGGTTVSAGTLQGSSTTLQGSILNHAAVVFDQGGNGTYAGSMSGTGSLTKQNSGTLTLSGTNSYSGGTTVSAGTLQGTTGSLQGSILNNAAVVFDQSSSGNYGGVISGSGSVTKQNSGTLTLTGANTYTGTTTVNAGTLAIGASNALSASSNLTLNSTATLAVGTASNGFSAQVGTLTYNTSIIDFGTANVANTLLFTNGGVSTGTLTINNFNTTNDLFAFQSGASGVDASFLNGIYFYGLGAGSLGGTQSISGYAGTWTLITPNTAAFKTWTSGGINSNWGTADNWDDNAALTTGSNTLRIAFGGGTDFSPVMNNDTTVNALRFNNGASSFAVSGQSGKTLTFDGIVPSIIQLSNSAQSMTMDVALNATAIVETTGTGLLTVSGAVSGSGGITKVGTETLLLSGANTYTGVTTISSGTVILADSAALGSTVAGTTVSGGATLQLQNNISVGAEALTLNGTMVNASGTNAYAGGISGSGTLRIDGGSLSLDGSTSNAYTGVTTVNGGTLDLNKTGGATAIAGNLVIGNGSGPAALRLLASNQIADPSAVTLNAGGTPVFNLNGFSETIGSLASSNASAGVQLGAGSLTTGGDNASTTFAGIISGTGTLTKQGTGSFTLSGANTYSGATTVAAGTLVVQHSTALGTDVGGTTVNSGATLQLQGNVIIGAEALTLNGTLRNASGANSFAGAIAGSGALTVDGGSLSLGGTTANTYSGLTTVGAGTLDLYKTAGVTAVAGNITIGDGTSAATVRLLASNQIADTAAISLSAGATTLNLNSFSETIGSLASSNASAAVQLGSGSLATGADNASTTFAGVISGTGGSLTKQGSGTMALTGANTYTGGTTISAGTLQGTTTSLQGAIANNAALVFDQATSGTYAGVLSGSGTLTKRSSGTVILAGANTYTGDTAIEGGTLQGSTSSLKGNVAISGGAGVVFDQGSLGTFSGNITGSGALTKQNTGTLILSGANSYTGGTTVSAGLLQGSTTSLVGNITNNAAVVFDQSATGTYSGAMSGTGTLTKQNSGTLTLTGANIYSGGTTVSAGTLQGTTGSLQGNITNNAAVVFDQSANGTYAGVISGTGTLTKQNSGNLTLTGANTYTGATILNAGRLVLGASNVLSTSTNLTLGAATTLSLNGTSSQRINVLNFNNSTIDFGTTGTANSLLLGNIGITTGTLTIANWTSGSDIFGIVTNSVSQTFLDSVYFTGINVGLGAVISTTTVNVPGFGNFYTLTPIPTFTWSGGQTTGSAGDLDNWSKSNNWVGGIGPGIAAVKSLVFVGSVQTTNDMDGAYQLKGLLFRSDAGAFTINSSTGDTLTLGGAGMINQSANLQTLNVPIAMSAAQTWKAESGNIQINGATTLNGANNLTLDGGFNITINGVVGSGGGGLIKNGAGILTLAGANTFTGGVTLNAGMVAISSDGNLGATAGGLTFGGGTLRTLAGMTSARGITLNAAGGTFDSNGFNSTLSGVIAGAGGLTKAGAGTLTLTGANTYNGGTTISGGTLAGNTTSLQGNIVDDAALIFDQASAGTFAGTISGTGSVTKQNSGTLILTGANTYSGGTTISAGSLQGTTASVQGNIANNSALVLDNSTAGTLAGVISGTGTLTKQNSGTVTLTGASTYSGATTVSAGTLIVQHSTALGTTAGGTTVATGATLQLENNITVGAEALALNGSLRNASGTNTYAGAISGTGAVNVDGGALTLSGTGANTYSGLTTVNSGSLDLNKTAGVAAVSGNLVIGNGAGSATVRLIAGNQISDTSDVTLNPAGSPVFNLNGQTETIGSLASSNAGAALQLGAGNLTTGGTNASTTFAGTVTGSGSLTKTGSGTFTLTGTTTYSGGTTVSGGTLQGHTGSLQGSIANNAAVVFDQSGNGTYAGVMSGSGSLAKQNSGTLTVTGANTHAGGTFINGGTLRLGASNALGAGALTIASGATFDLNGLTQTIGAFAGAGNVSIGAGTLIVGAGDASSSFAGSLAGSGAFQKTGAGTLTFTSSFNFAGELTLIGGTVALAGINVTVGTIRISGNTVLDFGNNAASILTATNLIIENGATLSIINWIDTQDYFYANGSFYGLNTGTLVQTPVVPGVRGSVPQNQITFSGFSGNSTVWLPYDRQITPAPEPATYGAMLMAGALGVIGLRRWRKRRQRYGLA